MDEYTRVASENPSNTVATRFNPFFGSQAAFSSFTFGWDKPSLSFTSPSTPIRSCTVDTQKKLGICRTKIV